MLNWLDACDKIARHKSAPASGWDEEHFQGVLIGLAARYILPHPLRLGEVRSVIAKFSSDIETILHDLRSEGVLIKTGTSYKVAAERLALGMGLYLLEELCVAHDQGRDVVECLRDFLSPHQEPDEMVAWLRSATIVALFGDSPKPKQVVDVLVHEWLSSRNLSPSDFQEVGAIRHLLLHPLLRLAPQVWSAKRDDQRLQELSQMIFVEAMVDHKELIGDALRTWFRLIPTAGATLFQRGHEDPEAAIRMRIADPDIANLNLKICGDAGILMLHRVGLYLLSKVPDLVGPDDLFALMAAQEIAGGYLMNGDCWAIRRALAQVSVTWFEEQMQRLPSDTSGRWSNILHGLIACAARADLRVVEEATKPPPDLWRELLQQLSLYDRAYYDDLRARPFSPDEHPARFMELARDVVRDPDLPKPCQERITAIRRVLPDIFFKTELQTGPFTTAEDYKFEQLLPAMAAWVPDIGATIVRRQIEGLPARGPDKQHW